MRHRKRENPVSLFAFQDIITGLCGIMVFVVLVQVVGLALEKVDGNWRVPEVMPHVSGIEELRSQIASLEKELAAVKVKSSHAVIALKDKARAEDVEKVNKELTEKELVVAALVSQVHDLETQVEAAKKADAEDEAKIREMERTRRLLEQQIAGLKGRKGITLVPERGEFKLPVYMICSWSGVEIHCPFEKRPKLELSPTQLAERLGEFLDGLDHTTHAVVLLVRPSGVKYMNEAVDVLSSRSFTYGRDPLEENVEVVFNVQEAK